MRVGKEKETQRRREWKEKCETSRSEEKNGEKKLRGRTVDLKAEWRKCGKEEKNSEWWWWRQREGWG